MQSRDRLTREIVVALRRVTVESQRLGHEFAARHHLHPTDFEALVHVMDAEGSGAPLTPGGLATALGMSSGATTAVIDRLERQGHIFRDRDTADRRRVHLRWSEHGRAIGKEFFGGLAPLSSTVTDPLDEHELEVVRQFLGGMADRLAEHRRAIQEGP